MTPCQSNTYLGHKQNWKRMHTVDLIDTLKLCYHDVLSKAIFKRNQIVRIIIPLITSPWGIIIIIIINVFTPTMETPLNNVIEKTHR